MSLIVFVDRTRIGWHRSYELRGRELLIERKVGGRRISERVDLSSIVRPSISKKTFCWAAINRSITYLSFVLLGAAIARSLAPSHSAFVVMGAVALASPGVYVILHYLRPINVEQFRDVTGKVLFDVFRSDKNDSAEFLAILNSPLTEDEPNQSTDPTLASGTPGAGHQSRHP